MADGHQRRIVANRRSDLYGGNPPGHWASRLLDRQQRDFKAFSRQMRERIENRLVFGRDTQQMIAAAARAFGDAADRQVVAFRGAAGRHTISLRLKPVAAAIDSRDRSTASRASQPNACVVLPALPYCVLK